jgi:hypothetical protein
LGYLALGPVYALVFGDLLEIFNRFVHEVTDVVDLRKNLSIGITLDKLLKLTINHSDAFYVSGVIVDLFEFRKEPIAFFIVAPGKLSF